MKCKSNTFSSEKLEKTNKKHLSGRRDALTFCDIDQIQNSFSSKKAMVTGILLFNRFNISFFNYIQITTRKQQ